MDSTSTRSLRGLDVAPAVAEEDSDDPRERSSSSSPTFTTNSRSVHNCDQPSSGSSFFDSFASSAYLDAVHRLPNLDPTWSRAGKRPVLSPLSPFAGATPNYGGAQPSELAAGIVHQGAGDRGDGIPTPVVKSGKKRSRASRRAPTTVLTTDTTNFRQMVQEFTGIPAPPFGSTSAFPRPGRLDLLVAAGGGVRGASPPSFVLRPFPHRPQILPLPNSTTAATDVAASVTDGLPNNLSSSTSATDSADYLAFRGQLSHLQASNLPSSMFSIHQPLTNQPPKFQLPNFLPGRPTLSPSPPALLSAQMKARGGAFDEIGGNPSHLGLDIVHMGNTMTLSSSIGQSRPFIGGFSGGGSGDQVCIRSSEVGGGGGGGSGCKVNYGVSTTDFHVEPGPSEAVPRGEGTLDSWICSSD